MVEQLAYGNRNQMIRFDVIIRQSLVDDLIFDGFLDEDEFDIDEYYAEETDEWTSPVARPVLEAIIEWYESKVEEMDEEVENATVRDEWEHDWVTYTDLEKIKVLSYTGDNFHDYSLGGVPLVEVKYVDPDDPYRSD